FFFSSRRRHTRSKRDWSSDVCSSDLLLAEEMLARSILFLDQSEARGPFYYQVFSEFSAVVNADIRLHTTLYAESLDLSRFNGARSEERRVGKECRCRWAGES